MTNKQDRINKIHEHLHGRLKDDEKLEFEKELELDAELQVEYTYWKNIEIDYRKSLYSKSAYKAIKSQESNRNRYIKYAASLVFLSCGLGLFLTYQYFRNKGKKDIANHIPKVIRLDTTHVFSKGMFSSVVKDINTKSPKEISQKLLSYNLNTSIIDTISIDSEPVFGGTKRIIPKDSIAYYEQLHLHLLAVNYYNLGSYSSALSLFKLVELDSIKADALWYQSLCYYNLGDMKLYRQTLKVISTDSSNVYRKSALKILMTK